MEKVIETDVVIIGGGPVGLAAAADLDARGIRSVVIERRSFLDAPNVKCNHVSARTMERFRLLGLASKLRNAGLPPDHPHDVSFRTSVTGQELSRIQIPARARRFTATVGPDTAWATPEPPHRINQRYIEPILMAHVAELPHVTLLNETQYTSFAQDDTGVTAHAEGAEGQLRIRAKYLVGADGGRSSVRKQMGATLSGDAVLAHVQSTCIRATGLTERIQGDLAWCYYTFNPRRSGHVYSIDGESVFLVHTYLTEEEAAEDSVDRDWAIREILGVDASFPYEIVSREDWIARRLVADRFRDDRVFIAGDACHLWVPYAGYGMNAGIADALNLTWLLGAVLSGWADDRIVDAYEAERPAITDQVSTLVKVHQRKIAKADVPDEIADQTPEGEAARAVLGAAAYELNVQQFAAEGLNFGYCYDASPIIIYDGEAAPPFTMGGYSPSTAPGCRAPHFWLADGVSLYDKLGLYYSMILSGHEEEELEPLVQAAYAKGVPLTVVAVDPELLPEEYSRRFTLVRQDQHVVWRGDALPANCEALIDRLRGAMPQVQET